VYAVRGGGNRDHIFLRRATCIEYPAGREKGTEKHKADGNSVGQSTKICKQKKGFPLVLTRAWSIQFGANKSSEKEKQKDLQIGTASKKAAEYEKGTCRGKRN